MKEDFIERAKTVHGDKYDYSKVDYKNNHTKVCIICPEHGEFWMEPNNHLNGQKCPICAGKFKRTTDWFIEKAKQIHGDRFDYSKSNYSGSQTKTIIICKKCGTEFLQTPNKHLQGRGCSYCKGNRFSTEEFIEKSKQIHGDKYDYSKANYINNNTKLEIICPKHGSFWQIPRSHFGGIGCPKCGSSSMTNEEYVSEAQKLYGDKFDYSKTNFNGLEKDITVVCNNCKKEYLVNARTHLTSGNCPYCGKHKFSTEEFIERAKKIHGDKYDYSKVDYKNINSKVSIICKTCQNEFQQVAYRHLCGSGCPKCKSSKGEKLISSFLKEHNINFEQQKRFKECKFKRALPFDFYLPDYNLCIEYQGIQHFEPRSEFGGIDGFNSTIRNDLIKREWCSKPKNPNLLEIKYNESIYDILEKTL